jgi:hypothetical protein
MATIRQILSDITSHGPWRMLRWLAVAVVVLALGLASHQGADAQPVHHGSAHVETGALHEPGALHEVSCDTTGTGHAETCSVHGHCAICAVGQAGLRTPAPAFGSSHGLPQSPLPAGQVCGPAGPPPKSI